MRQVPDKSDTREKQEHTKPRTSSYKVLESNHKIVTRTVSLLYNTHIAQLLG